MASVRDANLKIDFPPGCPAAFFSLSPVATEEYEVLAAGFSLGK